MMRKIYLIFLVIACQNLSAQANDSIALPIIFKFGKEVLIPGKPYISANKDTLQIDVIKLYLSNPEITYADKSSIASRQSQLIVFDQPETLCFHLPSKASKELTKLSFNIGIDSLSSVSGALAGDLDPAKGMYWAWQSGYINMKIEGVSKSCKTRKNEFHFHIGGYMQPYCAQRKITLTARKSSSELVINLEKFFSKVDLKETNGVMIPGKTAMKLADYSVQMFALE